MLAGEPDALERERAPEDQARRDARRRSARRYRRLTGKQKALIGVVLALTLLLVAAAVSGHKPRAHQAAHAVARRGTRPARKPTTPAVLPQTPTTRAAAPRRAGSHAHARGDGDCHHAVTAPAAESQQLAHHGRERLDLLHAAGQHAHQ